MAENDRARRRTTTTQIVKLKIKREVEHTCKLRAYIYVIDCIKDVCFQQQQQQQQKWTELLAHFVACLGLYIYSYILDPKNDEKNTS